MTENLFLWHAIADQAIVIGVAMIVANNAMAKGISFYSSNTDVELIEEDREIRQCRHM